ncbi:hypothetical protein LWI28_016826 [Acer negundo]|uniref:Uncharacterized protein n=1 Tax=Acer negundo TaxID=4023 RepID=A0AAD5IZT0_ACENE|nr:hypothetical protein LWI28_016826 [Acer negundo]KAK4847725.1 hypothetical protein QYF36_005108 [Acer negundo]
MVLLQSFGMPKSLSPLCKVNICPNLVPFSNPILPYLGQRSYVVKSLTCLAVSRDSDSKHGPEPVSKARVNPKTESRLQKRDSCDSEDEDSDKSFPRTIPRKQRRGRRSEAVAVEDFVRDSLEQTFASIRGQNSNVLENKENVLRDRVEDNVDSETSEEEEEEEDEDENNDDVGEGRKKKKMVVDDDDPNWPLDADVGWGIRASEYFEQHPIRNVVGEDGVEIDWEREIDDDWVKEINCLEWENFAFHPSPLVVLVFERYNRATDNWKTLKELEKAVKVYWSSKDRLPPRAIKIDINIERDLAYALKVKECPQILFLLGNRIIYREKEFRTSDDYISLLASNLLFECVREAWDKNEVTRFGSLKLLIQVLQESLALLKLLNMKCSK